MHPRRLAALIAGLILGILPMGPAWSGSSRTCENTYQSAYWSCAKSCTCVRHSCKTATNIYGAIAYDAKNRASGCFSAFGGAAIADRFALDQCSQNGDPCKFVASFMDKCLAVAAADNDAFAFATGEGKTSEEAVNRALTACLGISHHSPCTVQVSSCALR